MANLFETTARTVFFTGVALCASTALAQDVLDLRAQRVRFRDTPDLLKERTLRASDTARVLTLDGPMTPERRAALSKAGVQIKSFLEGNSFIAEIPPGSPAALSRLGFVRTAADFKPEWKIAPDLLRRAPARNFREAVRKQLESGGKLALIVSFAPGANPALARTQVASLPGAQILKMDNAGGDLLAVIALPAHQLVALSRMSTVFFIEEAPEFEDRNANARWIAQTNISNSTPMYSAGLNGTGQIIGIIESSTKLDLSHCSFFDPLVSVAGPTHRKVVYLNTPRNVGLHATHVSCTAAGDAGDNTNTRGIAYGARISFLGGLALDESIIYNLFLDNYNHGAFVHNNSWGNSSTNAYDVTCRAIDNFSWTNPNCLLMFATAESGPLTNPENAKNCIAVVASGNTPNQETIIFGGTGPTTDGRRKPEISAPGSLTSATNGTGCGTGGQLGTSMASPVVTGMAAMIRQYFTQGFYPSGLANAPDARVPSGALLKAMLLNGAVRMTSQATYPSDTAGWGRLLADRSVYLPGDSRKLLVRDQSNNAAGALSTSDYRYVRFVVTPGSEDLRATMAFHDAPGSVASSAPVVNNLDLTLIAPGRVEYRGNVFSNGWSTNGGSADSLNNVEMAMFQSPTPGVWFAKISAPAVNVGTQGYGLVLTGNVAEATCVCDLNADGFVDDADFVMFVSSYDLLEDPLGDFNGDGMTDDADFVIFVGAYNELLCP
ncbi:MAG: S8 family serine peptidase [Phycisphaeraceae bacterium]|nr:S8 family serine peptidase [Phycisphaeraceae bacterium]